LIVKIHSLNHGCNAVITHQFEKPMQQRTSTLPWYEQGQIAQNLHGLAATEEDVRLLRSRLHEGLVRDWLVSFLRAHRLAGVCFSLSKHDDKSSLGVDVIWLTPAQIVSEATECQPGISVLPLGYIPVGGCAEGSGDPYFLDLREKTIDPPVVRVPHDFAGQGPYPLDRVELVAESLSSFLSKATF
jgi:hypothetical protein